ncbi:hypothetical protein J6Z19_05780 [bacterium]|nr:hypothetical protein [bacterium]
MKKFFVLSLIVLSVIFLVSCGGGSKEEKENGKNGSEQTDDSDSGGTDSGSPEDYKVDENILEVPADQDNTAGALCDPKTFVESCDGNAYIDCYEDWVDDETYAYIVHRTECSGEAPICFVSKHKNEEENREYNWANCYSSCENENTGKSEGCTSYDNGYSFLLEEYECVETSKGKLKFTGGAYKPCDSGCSADGKTCEIKKCDLEKDKPYCDENGVLHECSNWEEGMVYQEAYFCGSMKMMTCRYDEDFGGFGCFEDLYAVDEDLAEIPEDQDNTEGASCDPDTFIEFCDGNTVVYCFSTEFEQNGHVIKSTCDWNYPVCFTHAYEYEEKPWNVAGCYASCDGENVGDGEICLTYDSGYTFELEKYKCIETSKGKLRFLDESTTCNSACSEDGRSCEIKECDPSKDKAYCDENGVLHECIEWSGMEIASFCNYEDSNMVCEYIEYDERFGCNYKPAD